MIIRYRGVVNEDRANLLLLLFQIEDCHLCDLKILLIDPIRCLVKLANEIHVDEKVKRHGISYMKQVVDSNL